MQDNVNQHLLRMLEGTFSLDAAHLITWFQRGSFDPKHLNLINELIRSFNSCLKAHVNMYLALSLFNALLLIGVTKKYFFNGRDNQFSPNIDFTCVAIAETKDPILLV